MRALQLLGTGAIMLQAGGCNALVFNEFVQTILLGITAAGSVAILRNI
jgi:hypothetical protein